MEDVIQLIDQVRTVAAAENERLMSAHRLGSGHPPIGGLNMIHNYATLSLELLSYYVALWSQILAHTVSDQEASRRENGERVVLLTKSVFIQCVSAIEFSAKQAIDSRPGRVPMPAGRVYLRRIIGQSVQAGLVSPADEVGWEGVIELRNTLVHNNGIAERTANYSLPGGPTISISNGRMSDGNLRFFPEVLLWVTSAFAAWADRFLS